MSLFEKRTDGDRQTIVRSYKRGSTLVFEDKTVFVKEGT